MDTSKLDRSEIIGMVAATLLVISLFLEWFSLSTDPSVVQRGTDPGNWACGVGNSSCSAWDTYPIERWLLLAAAAAPFILAWIVIRGHALSWPRGEVTAIVGLTAFVLIIVNGAGGQAAERPRDRPLLRLVARPARLDRDLHLRWVPGGGERRRRTAKTAGHVLT